MALDINSQPLAILALPAGDRIVALSAVEGNKYAQDKENLAKKTKLPGFSLACTNCLQ
jgi:hypothetical protein